jgi:peptidoglycan/xylan/chitin deacetylase (PgdA/CDA1 family)
MRFRAGGLFLCLAVGLSQPSQAQQACPNNPRALGVARTVSIDTSAGPRYGADFGQPTQFLGDGEIVLTFDDGPSRAYTTPILAALAAHCTKATFFMVGAMATADPAMVKEVARQGHTLATHTWSHANLQGGSAAKVRTEIELGFSSVQLAAGSPIAPFFRFPYLRHTPSSLGHVQERQIASFGIDVDSKDYMTRDAATVRERVLRDLAGKRKGIILFHDIHASTANALPGLLAELKARGFRVVHMKAKAQAETLAEYDALAQQAADRRRLAGGNALAKRALTWPSTTLSENGPGANAPPPPSRRPDRKPPPEEDWFSNLFRW